MKTPDDKKVGFSSILSLFFNSLFSSLKSRAEQGAGELLGMVESRVLLLQKKLFRNLFIALCVLAGIAALLVSLCFYLINALRWPSYAVFLILGAVLLIIASVLANLKD